MGIDNQLVIIYGVKFTDLCSKFEAKRAAQEHRFDCYTGLPITREIYIKDTVLFNGVINENFDTLINFIVDNKMGINIGDQWFYYDKISNILTECRYENYIKL